MLLAAQAIMDVLDAFRTRTRAASAKETAAVATDTKVATPAAATVDGGGGAATPSERSAAADGKEKAAELRQRAGAGLKELMGNLRAPGKRD